MLAAVTVVPAQHRRLDKDRRSEGGRRRSSRRKDSKCDLMQPFATMIHLNFELVRKTAGRSVQPEGLYF